MSIGLGIFLASLIFGLIYLYGTMRGRWDWKGTSKWLWRALGFVAVGSLILGSGIIAYDQYKRLPRLQKNYADLSLGQTMAEVKYLKDTPNNVAFAPDPATCNGNCDNVINISSDTIPVGKSISDYIYWEYTYTSHTINIVFSKEDKKLERIICFSNEKNRCPPIFDLADGNSEIDVIRKVGKPTFENINFENGYKQITYRKYGTVFYLEKQSVLAMGIAFNIPIGKAPPCRNNSKVCKPAERNWNGKRPEVGVIVTDHGSILAKAG